MTAIVELRAHVQAVRTAHGDVSEASARLLAYERCATNSIQELHGSLTVLGEALQRAAKAQRELARVLALDPDKLAGDEPLVEPMLESTVADNECECSTGQRTPLNCWSCTEKA